MERRGVDLSLIDQYYENLAESDGWKMMPGQFYFAHSTYPVDYPDILKLKSYDPKNEVNTTFTIKAYSDGDEKHYPVKELGLREDELFYVYKGKRRLVVVLGVCKQTWHDDDRGKNTLLCAPVFRFKPRHSIETVVRTQAFGFENWFYLPPDCNGCTEESAIRFELIQPIMGSCLQPFTGILSRKPVVLSQDARTLLLLHLSRFLRLTPEITAPSELAAARLIEDLAAYRDTLLESIQATRPASP